MQLNVSLHQNKHFEKEKLIYILWIVTKVETLGLNFKLFNQDCKFKKSKLFHKLLSKDCFSLFDNRSSGFRDVKFIFVATISLGIFTKSIGISHMNQKQRTLLVFVQQLSVSLRLRMPSKISFSIGLKYEKMVFSSNFHQKNRRIYLCLSGSKCTCRPFKFYFSLRTHFTSSI